MFYCGEKSIIMEKKKHAGQIFHSGPRVVLWKIDDFFSLLDKMKAYIVSPSFLYHNKTWCMELYFGTFLQRNFDTEDWVCLDATPRNIMHVQHFVYKCEMKKGNGSLYRSIDFTEFDSVAYLLPISEFFQNRSEISPKGSVTFMVEFRPQEEKWAIITTPGRICKSEERKCFDAPIGNAEPSPVSRTSHLEGVERSKDLNILSDNLKDLYLKGLHCDMTFQVGEQEFQAHKSILASRSPIFEDMMHIKTESGKVDIADCEPDVFHQFLLYLYSGKAETLTAVSALSLYTLADNYKVDALKANCVHHLKETLSVDTFCEVIELATKHNES